jgi:hypothetical protein
MQQQEVKLVSDFVISVSEAMTHDTRGIKTELSKAVDLNIHF